MWERAQVQAMLRLTALTTPIMLGYRFLIAAERNALAAFFADLNGRARGLLRTPAPARPCLPPEHAANHRVPGGFQENLARGTVRLYSKPVGMRGV